MNFKLLSLKSRHLEKQMDFYSNVLGFALVTAGPDEFVVQTGHSQLHMQRSAEEVCYHFAFNIPYRQVTAALAWLKTRVAVLQDNGQDIIDFSNWKARAIYFLDEDQNIVEFIGRSTIPVREAGVFSADAIMEISEIGMPVQYVQASLRQMKWVFDLDKYGPCTENFCAVGSEKGLFIVVDEATKKWYPTSIPVQSFEWELVVQRATETYTLYFDGELIRLQ